MRSVPIALVTTAAILLAAAPVYLKRAGLGAREVDAGAPLRAGGVEETRPSLLLTEWQCLRADGWISIEGEVRNRGSGMLANVTAVGVFQDANKDLVKSDRALLRDSTLLPGQASRFAVATVDDPAIASCALDFGHLMGGSIRFTEAVQGAGDEPGLGPDDVRTLQLRLGALGYDAGLPDGVLGPRTRDAIMAFQEDRGLPPDGRISRQLIELLPSGS